MQIDIIDVDFVEFGGDKARHALPLAEHNHFFVALFKERLQDVHRLVDLGVMARLLVEYVRGIAHHAHLREQDEEFLTVFFGQEVQTPPFQYELRHLRFEFVVHLLLLVGHRDKKVLVHAARHLEGDLFFGAADKASAHLFADFIKILIANHFAAAVREYAISLELPERTQQKAVGKFHHGVEFFEAIFQRRARKYHGIV